MLDWYWLDDDTCVFTVRGGEIARCNDEDFDKVLATLLCKYRTR